MALKLMYITNDIKTAKIAENAGTDRIFIDMEYIGKAKRQGGMDTVQSHHTIQDIRNVRAVLSKAELLVRINPLHDGCNEYASSEKEINDAIDAGADILMLPYFKTVDEVRRFIEYTDGRAKVFPLLETPEAADSIEEILELEGIDEIHIGINDLSLGYGKNFMFEMLADGTVERLCGKIKDVGIPFGFGGIASPGKGLLPAEYIIGEHYRLGSTRVILSRSFCRATAMTNQEDVNAVFTKGIRDIRSCEAVCEKWSDAEFEKNRLEVVRRVNKISEASQRSKG
jgi:2-keto-3-deoxy-L-rhamnonate aldolase RhmA